MSRDDGIYVLHLKDSCRVTKMYAGENVLDNFVFMYQAFNDAVQTKTFEEAIDLARTMQKEHRTEHGIRVINSDEYVKFTWAELVNEKTPKIIKEAKNRLDQRLKKKENTNVDQD